MTRREGTWCKNPNCILNSLNNNNNDENSSKAAGTGASSSSSSSASKNNKMLKKMDSLQREKLAMHLVQCAGELVAKPLWWHYAEKKFNFLQNNFQNEVVLKELFVKCAKLLKSKKNSSSDVVVVKKLKNGKKLSKTRNENFGGGGGDMKKVTVTGLRRSKRPGSSLALALAAAAATAQPAPPLGTPLSKADFLKSFALVPNTNEPSAQDDESDDIEIAPTTRKRITNFANMPISSDLAKRVLAEKKNNMPEMFKLKRLEKTERHVNKKENKRAEIDYPVAFNQNDANCAAHHYKMPRRQSHQNNSSKSNGKNGLIELCRPVVVHLKQMKFDGDGGRSVKRRRSGDGKKRELVVRIGKEERLLCDKKSDVKKKYLRFGGTSSRRQKIKNNQ